MVILEVVLQSQTWIWWKENKLSIIEGPLSMKLASGNWGEEYEYPHSKCIKLLSEFKSHFYFFPSVAFAKYVVILVMFYLRFCNFYVPFCVQSSMKMDPFCELVICITFLWSML